jgi:hypothetical protein
LTYRDRPRQEPEDVEIVTVSTYVDVVQAELGKTALSAAGIEAFVVETTGFNPALASTVGAVRLEVRAYDADRAAAVLRRVAGPADEDDDGEGPDAVRCPRCELAYCSFGPPRMWTASGLSADGVVGFLLGWGARRDRWRCQMCFHVWDDAGVAPRAQTKLGPDDPRPVFRLRRRRGGTGWFFGSLAAAAALPFAPEIGWILLGAGGATGWLVGRQVHTDLCSEPGCRTPLRREMDECPRCRGAVHGTIDFAHEHFARAAEVRRALRDARARTKKKKRKGARARGHSVDRLLE